MFISISCLIIYLFLIFSQPLVNLEAEVLPEKQVGIGVDFSRFEIPIKLQESVTKRLEAKDFAVLDGTRFVITNVTHGSNDEVFLSIASLDGKDAVEGYIGIGKTSSLIVGKLSTSQEWKTAILGESDFPVVINSLTANFVSPENKKRINKVSTNLVKSPTRSGLTSSINLQSTLTTIGYKFPWAVNTSPTWGFWQTWFHNSDPCADSVCSMDLGTTGDDKRVLAATSGTVSHICNGLLTKNVTIVGDDGIPLQYFHIDKDTFPSGIVESSYIIQGQILGSVKTGNFGPVAVEGCGYANQNNISGHLHWVIPKSVNLSIQGWSIQFPTSYWTNGSTQVYTSYNPAPFFSTNIPNNGQSITPSKIQEIAGYYDSDNKTDLAMFDPSSGHWYIRYTGGAPDADIAFGWSTVIPIGGGDYDGDGKTDLAIFEPSTGHWYVKPSGGGPNWDIVFGWSTTLPVGGIKYDNDNKTDFAIFDTATGHWYIRPSAGGVDWNIAFGWASTIPLGGGYYDTDNKTDLALFDKNTGHWYIKYTGGAANADITFGWGGVIPVGASKYDSDVKTDLAIFDPASGHWYIRPSAGGTDWNIAFGWGSTLPIPGMNYDTNSPSDLAVFDSATGRWYIHPSGGGTDWNILFGWQGVIAI